MTTAAGHGELVIQSRTLGGLAWFGILPNATYEAKTWRSDRGGLLALFSDGVTEACGLNGDEEFGEARLAEFVQK